MFHSILFEKIILHLKFSMNVIFKEEQSTWCTVQAVQCETDDKCLKKKSILKYLQIN